MKIMKTLKRIIFIFCLILLGLNTGYSINIEKDTSKKITITKVNYFNESLFVTSLKQSLYTNDYSYLDAFWSDSIIVIFTKESCGTIVCNSTKDSIKQALSLIINNIPNCNIRLFSTRSYEENIYTAAFIIPERNVNIYVDFYIISGKIRKILFR